MPHRRYTPLLKIENLFPTYCTYFAIPTSLLARRWSLSIHVFGHDITTGAVLEPQPGMYKFTSHSVDIEHSNSPYHA